MTEDIKKNAIALVAIFTFIGSVVTSWIWFNNQFQGKDEAEESKLEIMLLIYDVEIGRLTAKEERGIALTVSEKKALATATSMHGMMKKKQLVLQGLAVE